MRLLIEMQADIENRDAVRIKDGRLVWHMFTDMDNQFVETIDAFPPARVSEKAEKNIVAIMKVPELNPGESFSPTVILRIDTISRDWLMEPQETSDEFVKRVQSEYCRMQKFWELEDSTVQEISERIAEKSNSDESYSRIAMQAVRERVKLKTHLDTRLGAARAASEREGDCDEHADLFISLTRAVRIPSRRVIGHLFRGNPEPEPHAWCEVFLRDKGWIPVDPALGQFGVLTENYFSRVREGLVSERPTIQLKMSASSSNPVSIEEKIQMRVLANGDN